MLRSRTPFSLSADSSTKGAASQESSRAQTRQHDSARLTSVIIQNVVGQTANFTLDASNASWTPVCPTLHSFILCTDLLVDLEFCLAGGRHRGQIREATLAVERSAHLYDDGCGGWRHFGIGRLGGRVGCGTDDDVICGAIASCCVGGGVGGGVYVGRSVRKVDDDPLEWTTIA
eukprot:4207881-Prymnesium_polylepis.1